MVVFFHARFIFPFFDSIGMGPYQDSKLQRVAYWRWLEKEIEKISTELEKTVEERDDALERVKCLEAKLRIYENPNTLRFKKTSDKKNKGKRGAPKGHPGTTRKRPVPEVEVDVKQNLCPHCRAALGKPEKTLEKVIEDIIPARVVTTRFQMGEYTCPGAKRRSRRAMSTAPKRGDSG